ncbi:MAG: oligosaccharide flippase family protein, partial [Clostridia bacterium]|nr:oligosaccharide flippase family protein [Clostridia bacterium]
MGDIGFGYFSSVYDIYLPIYALATTGIPSSISRIISEYLAEKDCKNVEIAFLFFKKIMFIFGAIGTLVLLLVAFPFVKLTDNTGNTLFTYLLMCPAVLFSFFSSPLRGFSEGNRNMIPTAISNIIDAFSKILIGFSSAFITIKLTGNFALSSAAAIGGIALGTVISYIFLNIYNSRHYKREKSNIVTEISNKVLLNKLYKICIPIIITSFSINIFPFIDSLTVRPVLSGILDSQNNILSIIDANYISDFSKEIP